MGPLTLQWRRNAYGDDTATFNGLVFIARSSGSMVMLWGVHIGGNVTSPWPSQDAAKLAAQELVDTVLGKTECAGLR